MVLPFQYDSTPEQRLEPPQAGSEGAIMPFQYQGSLVSTPPPVDLPTAQERAKKWDFGLGADSPGKPALTTAITTGTEKDQEALFSKLGAIQEAQIRKQVLGRYIEDNAKDYSVDNIKNIQRMGDYVAQANHDTIMPSDYFAHKYSEKATNSMFEWWLNKRTPSEADFQGMDYVQRQLYIKESIQKFTENLKKEYDAAGWTGLPTGEKGGIAANLERFIPLLYDARMRSEFWSLTGNDLVKQYGRVLNMDNPEDAIAEAKRLGREIFDKNPSAGIHFLHGMLAYSSSDANFDNAMSIIDFSSVPGLTYGIRQLRSFVQGVQKATANRTTDFVHVLETSGKIEEAAAALAARVAKKLDEAPAGAVSGEMARSFQELKEVSIGLQQGSAALEGTPYQLVREKARRILEAMEQRKVAVDTQITNAGTRIQRLEQESEALAIGGKEADDIFNKRYPDASSNILDVRTSNIDDGLTNNYFRHYQIGLKNYQPELAKSETGLQIQTRMSGSGDVVLIPSNQHAAETIGKETTYHKGPTYIGPPAGEKSIFDLKAGNDNLQVIVGDPYLLPFSSPEVAGYAAKDFYKMKPGDFAITPKGNGWVIETRQAIPETSLKVRNELRVETGGDVPLGWSRFFSSILPLSKDAKLAPEVMEAAKLVGYSHKNQQEFIRQFLKPIDELRTGTKKGWNDFKDFIEQQRHFSKDGEFGRFSRSLGEFEQDWMTQFGRLPSEAEHSAYWSYVQLSDTDWVMRNLSIYRDKTRQGRNMFTLEAQGGKAEIEGKLIHEMPSGSEVPYGFIVWDKDPANIRVNRSNRPVKASGEYTNLQAYRDAVINGDYKLIQLAEYSERELRDKIGIELPKGRINYALVKDFESASLPFQQIPYRPGGHRVYDYQWYARQPDLRVGQGTVNKSVYYHGDLNHMGFESEAVGKEYLNRFNTARTLLDKGDEAAMTAYVSKNLPYSPEHFKRFFTQGKGELDSSIELKLTRTGENVDTKFKLEDSYKATHPDYKYVRTSESPHNLNNGQINLALAQERNDLLPYIDAKGRGSNMQLNFNQGKFLDPMVTVQRSAENIANAKNLDDLKIKATERFIAEFSDGLSWDINRLRSNPMQALIEAPIKASPGTIDYWTIMEARRATLELLGMRTPFQKGMDSLQQKIYESLYGSAAGKAIGDSKIGQVVAEWALPSIKDPTKALRQIAFHTKQGLMNVASLVNQAQQVFSISAIETTLKDPLRAPRASMTGWYMSALRFWENNPAMIEHFAADQAKAGKFGMPKEDFIEMFGGLKESGYHKVGKEVADYAQWVGEGTTVGKFGKVLDYSTWFFKRGEELGRYTSYSAAYQRWKFMNPDAVFDSAAKTEVLNRADFLNLGMSGMSNSVLQKGVPGVVTQFFTAHLRQAEQIIGRKLDPYETARLITSNSLLYGLPVGLGTVATAGLWPARQQALQTAAKYPGFDPTDHVATNILMNGFLSVGLEKASGMQYDTSSLGLGGISLFKDLYEGQKGAGETLTGAAGRTVSGFYKSVYPFYNFLKGQGELRNEDFKDVITNVSTFNAVEKAWYAIAYGKYMGRSEQRMDNITGPQGVISALLGVSPQTMAQMSAEIAGGKNIEATQKAFAERYGLYIRRAFDAADKGDDEAFHANFARANLEFKAGNFQENKRFQMFSRAIQDNMPTVDRVHKSYLDKLNSPDKIDDYVKWLKKRGYE